MSNPKNPLSEFSTYVTRHTLLAFDTTEGACGYTMPVGNIGKCGDSVKGVPCGNAIVVVNEIEDASYFIRDLLWSFDFFSPIGQDTTISAGNFTVADSKGNQFPSFLRRVAQKLGIPQSKITFYLSTSFKGTNGTTEIPDIKPAPIIFTLTDFATGFRSGMINMFTFNFTMLYNTTGQFPNHAQLDQFTLTNREKNPSKSIPTSDGAAGVILPRAQEDAANNPKRDERMSKSQPMRTLKEIFESLEADLKELRFENKRQLQEFISLVRPDAIKKIKPPKAKRVKAGDSIPITFKVNLEDVYNDYPVDNMNLMTEQTETKQLSTGIRSLTVEAGTNIVELINTLMKLSTRTADDIKNGLAFKVVISSVTDCSGIVNNTINIKQYTMPVNKVGGKDTGPDPKGTVNKLEFIYLDGTAGLDISALTFSSAPVNDITILEEDSDDLDDDPLTFSSQREQLTYERPENSGLSGLRALAPELNYGLTKAIHGTAVDHIDHRFVIPQNTVSIVSISGNPDLYSDLARNPAQVSAMTPGTPRLYKFPEYYPMYVTLKVRIAKSHHQENDKTSTDEEYWYHTYHYHLSGVTNSFVGGKFVQTLRLLSTSDTI